MKLLGGQIRLTATDLSNHLACHHLTMLDMSVVRGRRATPDWSSPDLFVLRELGLRHEAAYFRFLQEKGLSTADLRGIDDEEQALLETRSCMERGVDVIAQGSLAAGRWFGQPDVLQKVPKPGRLGEWSYEAYDCKLTRETKSTTILQLALYSSLLAEVQGEEPESMYVVPAGQNFAPECYRIAEFAAYYRYVRRRLEEVCDNVRGEQTYPESCEHCEVCRWFRECDARRRQDDHLSLVAGITRLQRNQLNRWEADTMVKLSALPIPLQQKPLHGSKEAYQRVREQARVQVQGRTRQAPVHEILPLIEGTGFRKLPEPSRLDVFVDLEGDPFVAESGREYLFGFVPTTETGQAAYEKRWSFTAGEEKRAFEWIVDEIIRRWNGDPAMHVYHFGTYEPSAFKSLMGRHVTKEDEVDRMLRAGLFIDLHRIFKQAVRASVEEYSLKALESLHSFPRNTPLAESREAMRYVEHWLELGSEDELPDRVRNTMEGYNEDDCRSTASLRSWLEAERKKIVDAGTPVPRPTPQEGSPSEELDERQRRIAALYARLVDGVPKDPADQTDQEEARWMLAQLLDWHRRENKATWWEGFRLAELDDEDLLDERAGLAGLQFVERVDVERKIPVDRYAFEKQETEVRPDTALYYEGKKIGSTAAIDLANRIVDIKKTKKTAELHPNSVYMWDQPRNTSGHADALFRIGVWVTENGIDAPGPYRASRDLLLRRTPRLGNGGGFAVLPAERPTDTAGRTVAGLAESAFAIQGPPGAGKTYTGARTICRIVSQGKKVGITALSHKVIRKLLSEVLEAANDESIPGVRCLEKTDEEDDTGRITVVNDNAAPRQALLSGTANVVGGTSWLWTRPEYFEAVDFLLIDEAGQMALADVIAVAQAAKNLVLIGDPQQLERPLKGSHPPGAEKSALQHLLGDRKTIPENMGLLLPETWRLHPEICKFTSELFYDGRLGTRDFTRNRVFEGHPWLTGAGLWFVPVSHEGNRNSSTEEVAIVSKIVKSLVKPEVRWFWGIGNSRAVRMEDILIVAPYNAQVADILARLPGAQVGTVDKFQGQEAPVVIYSLATSSPEDAPHGMEFLYSLNRLNVATSRGMSAVILVASPSLLEPECHTPRQMQLANALCRFAELGQSVQL